MKTKMIILLSAVVILAVLSLVVWLIAKLTRDETPQDPMEGLKGKYLSILGDSISTMQYISDGPAQFTVNSTLPNASWCYNQAGGRQGVTLPDTWWQQAADQLGMQILVNNSWSGSLLLMGSESAKSVPAYEDRCVQLHSDVGELAGTDPDIIAFYMGTNDFIRQKVEGFMVPIGNYAETAKRIDAGELWRWAGEGFTYGTPLTTMDAYAICLHKISRRYPDAEVYCFTMLPATEEEQDDPRAYNEEIKQLVGRFDFFVTDLYDCGFQRELKAHRMLSEDGLHPNKAGMDAITAAFISSITENSRYVSGDVKRYQVEYLLENVVCISGMPKTVLAGQSLELQFVNLEQTTDYMAVVTIDGKEVDPSCYGEGKITIPEVTGNLKITVKAV